MLSQDQHDELSHLGRRASYRRGQVLFREGDPAGSVFVVGDGRVKVHATTPAGRDVVLAIKGRGELVGELSAIEGRPRSATATVAHDVTAVVVPAAEFRTFVARHPVAAMDILRRVCAELRTASEEQVLRDGTVLQRLAGRLLSLAVSATEHEGTSIVIPLELGHDDLAAWISTSRESVTRAMGALRAAGAITSRRGRITVVDLDVLRAHTAAPDHVPDVTGGR